MKPPDLFDLPTTLLEAKIWPVEVCTIYIVTLTCELALAPPSVTPPKDTPPPPPLVLFCTCVIAPLTKI